MGRRKSAKRASVVRLPCMALGWAALASLVSGCRPTAAPGAIGPARARINQDISAAREAVRQYGSMGGGYETVYYVPARKAASAVAAVVAHGDSAVPGVVEQLRTEKSPYEAIVLLDILRRIGSPTAYAAIDEYRQGLDKREAAGMGHGYARQGILWLRSFLLQCEAGRPGR